MLLKFWYKALLLIGLSVLSLAVYFALFADGTSDNYYLRFTSRQQSSMILGTSRAAQGILPEIFNESDLDFDGPMYNFAFTMENTPYGPIYLEAINRKLESGTEDGLFILEVNPFSISTETENDDPLQYREVDNFIDTLHLFNMQPNLEYLLSAYAESYYTLMLKSLFDRKSVLRQDGWLDVTVPMDEESVNQRQKAKVEQYRTHILSTYEFSPIRLDALSETIEALLGSGTVLLVRLPTDCTFYEMESGYLPDFDRMMEKLSDVHAVPYINLAPDCSQVKTTDGNHLWKESGRLVSNRLLREAERNMEK